MWRQLLALAFVSGLLAGTAAAQSRDEKVRNDRKKVEAAGYWIYNDLPKAVDEAKRTGKPIIAVLRCIPCEECVKLDDEIIDGDARLKPLLEQYVRARVVSTNGLDLSLFQFDTDQSFAIFLLNADGTIYGRFGTRSDRTSWIGDVSVEGLAKAMEGALALHKEYPSNKAELAAKRGPTPDYSSPEKMPLLKDKYTATLNYQGDVARSCIHCHQIGDAVRDMALSRGQTLPQSVLFPYPHPKALGLILDPAEMATVSKVDPTSPADKSGFKAGDKIEKLAGQPLLSIADVQWVLHHTSPNGAQVKADVLRDGKPTQVTLNLESGWRQRDDISWRTSTWGLRRAALGGMFLIHLPDEDRQKWKLPKDSTALLVQHVGQFAPHNLAQQAGVRKGDVLLGYDSRSDLLTETELIAYALREGKPAGRVPITVLREGKKQELTITFPK